MTIADAAILAAHKTTMKKNILGNNSVRRGNPVRKTVITPVTSNFEKEQKIEETTEDKKSQERKEQSFLGIILLSF